MIKQPKKGSRNVNDLFYEDERQQIDELNKEFFSDVELTAAENDVLVWLCSQDGYTFGNMVAAFRKAGDKIIAERE